MAECGARYEQLTVEPGTSGMADNKGFIRTCGYDSLVSHSALFAEQLTRTFEVLVLLIVVVSYDDFYSMKK